MNILLTECAGTEGNKTNKTHFDKSRHRSKEDYTNKLSSWHVVETQREREF